MAVAVEQGGSAGDVVDGVLAGGAALLVAGVLCVMWMMTPITHSASRVDYSQIAINEMAAAEAMGRVMSPDMLARFEQHYGMDISRVMLPADREPSRTMKQVAETCFTMKVPADSNMILLPTRGHAAFAAMTDYLICAMRTNTQRLCDPTERKRLAEQLVQYKDRRQNVLAFERGREALLATPMAQFATKMGERANPSSGPVGRPFLGEEIDERITQGIAALNRQAASDFSFMGLFLPAEYAPALVSSARGVARCS